ncbi:hypothetical protein BDZ90DRAFT_36466 [Jaminaea rosea]|uniref:Uncharacterized protein n=1 Tax=Jaminaea rosea TaxID=1569628 RepID=A0A316V0Q1_9BASI|nr:hypothetical protein BDZ90DRAFT_36466 [Jaminaea rosea]PWN31130.1 hypothetical protein BDZ90DRAFT_36466 [Jaminaea rosea]
MRSLPAPPARCCPSSSRRSPLGSLLTSSSSKLRRAERRGLAVGQIGASAHACWPQLTAHARLLLVGPGFARTGAPEL